MKQIIALLSAIYHALEDKLKTFISDAPKDSKTYGRNNGTWKEITASGGGTGDTTNYNDLSNKPTINNVELSGNKTSADLKLQPAGDYATNESVNNKSDKIQVITVEGIDITQKLSPNKYYKFDEVTNLTITLAVEIAEIYNEYMFEFISGATATILTLPDNIKWIGDNTIEVNKTYQVSIVNNQAVIGGV